MMGTLCSSSSLQMALTATVYFMVVLTTCSTHKCKLQIAEKTKDRSVVLTKSAIKLIQVQCMEDFCRQSDDESKNIEKTNRSSVHLQDHPKVLTEHCGSVICNHTSQCVEQGCGKVCMEAPSLCDLHDTLDTGDLSTLKHILSKGRSDINCQDWIGRTPVMLAAGKGYRKVMEFLVSKGADVFLVDRYGINILHSACLGGDVEVVNYILSQNMLDINSRVQCGRTPVMLAAENGHKGVLELLVGKGSDVSLVDNRRNTILHCACRGGDVEVVKYILSQNMVDINSRSWRGRTPIMVAERVGHEEVVELLVKNGADLSLTNRGGNSIFHLACQRGHKALMKYVISKRIVSINSRGWKKRTPVMMAGERGHKAVVELLVKNGADLSLLDEEGDNILHLACYEGRVDVVKYVLSQGFVDINSRGWKKRTPVMMAGARGHTQLVEVLVKNGADMSLLDVKGDNILHLACRKGCVDVLKYVLSLDTVDINSRGWKKRTPVMMAGVWGHKAVVEFLVQHGADLSLLSETGRNILHVACHQGRVDVVKYVVSQGFVDINSRDRKKKTPVMVARERGHKKAVELLVKNGADLSLLE